MLETAEIVATTTRDARFRRSSKIDLTRIRVRRASTAADLEIAGNLREAGFAHVVTQNPSDVSWIDELDTAPGVVLFSIEYRFRRSACCHNARAGQRLLARSHNRHSSACRANLTTMTEAGHE